MTYMHTITGGLVLRMINCKFEHNRIYYRAQYLPKVTTRGSRVFEEKVK